MSRRKIDKRTREAAIHCLEQCASDRIGGVAWTITSEVYDTKSEIHVEYIAGKAWIAVNRFAYDLLMPMAIQYLEAAALLRDGWNPGDPVEVRR